MGSKKSALIVLDDFLPVTAAGSVRIHNFMATMTDWDIIVIGGYAGSGSGFLVRRPSERSPLQFLLFLARLSWRAIRISRARKFDLVLLSIPKYELLWMFPFLRSAAPIRILDIRDSLKFLDYASYLKHFLPHSIAVPAGRLIQNTLAGALKRACNAATLITVANVAIKNWIEPESQTPVAVIPNGVDTDVFVPAERRKSEKLQLVYMGNFAEKDRFEPVLEGAAQFRESIVVHLIGDGRARAQILERFREKNIDFTYHGLLSHAQLPKILNSMDLGFIFRDSGVNESIPVSTFEFASMNIPTVVNRVGLMADFVERNGLGFVANTPEEFSQLLAKLLKSRDELQKFENLHRIAVKEFSLKRSRELFSEVLEGRETEFRKVGGRA